MKKIIIALDGEHFPKGAFEFAKYVNNQKEILLAGVFLSPVDYSKLMAYSGGMEGIAIMPELLTKNDDEDIVALSSLVEETRFADLLLVSSELFFKNVESNQPNYYLEELLKKAECPVMLIPENFKEPDQILLSYDGGQSSIFAIKQFAYLFPELVVKQTTLVSVIEDDKEELPEYVMMNELVASHYPALELQNLKMDSKKHFVDWLAGQPNSFIVMGAFSRSMFSELFKKSFAKDIIREIKMPLFISHK